jgi:hypothetical protein
MKMKELGIVKQQSLTAKDAKDAKEIKSLTAKDAKDTKENFSKSPNIDFALFALRIVVWKRLNTVRKVPFASLASFAVELFSSLPSRALRPSR